MKTSFAFVFRRRIQDVLIKTNIFALVIRLEKTSWSRPIYSFWPYAFKTSSRRFQDVFQKRLQDIFKTSSKRLQGVLQKRLQDLFKTCLRRLQDLLQRYFQEVFKMHHQVKLFLLTSHREVLKRRLSTDGFAYVTLRRNLWSMYKIWKGDKNFSSFIVFYFTNPFSGCLQRGI